MEDEDNIDSLDFDKKDYDIRELVVDEPPEKVDFSRAVQSVIPDMDRLLS